MTTNPADFWVGPAHVRTGHQDAEIQRLQAELAESQARCVRLEGHLRAAVELVDSPEYNGMVTMAYVHGAIGQGRMIFDAEAARSALTPGPSALEAVREAERVLSTFKHEYDIFNRLISQFKLPVHDFTLGPADVERTLAKLRAAFGLEGE